MSGAGQKVLEGLKSAGGAAGGGGGGGGGAASAAGALARFAVGAGVLSWGAYNSLFNVEGGHRAVMFSRLSGVQDVVKEEGTHFMIPWVDMPVIYDVRTKPRNIQSLTGSKDLQMVNVTIRVLSKPDVTALPWIYQRLGQDYDERVLPSIVNEVLKQVVARYNASQLLTQREMVSRQIREALVQRAHDFRIVLDDVSITHLTFSPEYTAAVEAKQVAQQDAERAKFIVDKALQDKKSVVIRAQGEAAAAELVGKAIRDNPGFVELRRIEAANEIAETLSHGGNRVFLDTEGLLLNMRTQVKQ